MQFFKFICISGVVVISIFIYYKKLIVKQTAQKKDEIQIGGLDDTDDTTNFDQTLLNTENDSDTLDKVTQPTNIYEFDYESDTLASTVKTAQTNENSHLSDNKGKELTAKEEYVKAIVNQRPNYIHVSFNAQLFVENNNKINATPPTGENENTQMPIINLVNVNTMLSNLIPIGKKYKKPKFYIKVTNDYKIEFYNVNQHDWLIDRKFTHLHYNVENSQAYTMIAHLAKITVKDEYNNSYVFMLIKDVHEFSQHLIEVFCLHLKDQFVKEESNLKYLHIQFIGLGKKINWFIHIVQKILSNLFDLQYDEKLSYITLKPTNFSVKYEKTLHILKYTDKITYSPEFMFFADNLFDTEQYLDNVRDYFIRTEYFGICQCYNNSEQPHQHIYGKLVPSENESDENVIIENTDQQIKIINVNNRNTFSDTLKDIIYRFAVT